MTDKRCFSVSELSDLLGRTVRERQAPVREADEPTENVADALMESYESNSAGRREADESRQARFAGEAADDALGSGWRESLTEELGEGDRLDPSMLTGA